MLVATTGSEAVVSGPICLSKNSRRRRVSSGSAGMFCFSWVNPIMKTMARPDSRKSTYAMASVFTTRLWMRMKVAISVTKPACERGQCAHLVLHQGQHRSRQFFDRKPRPASGHRQVEELVPAEGEPGNAGNRHRARGHQKVVLGDVFA